jgi:creatinine amidohydrolase
VADRGVILADAPYRDISKAHVDVAVLPWGATEPHNLHLPYGTDNVETVEIASASARLASEKGAHVIVLPIIPFGVNTGQMDLPLTINMNPRMTSPPPSMRTASRSSSYSTATEETTSVR